MIKNMTRTDQWYVGFAYVCLALFTLVVALPIINLIAVALSGTNSVTAGMVGLWPKDFQLDAFAYVLNSKQFFTSLKVSTFMMLVGSFLGVILAVMAAYPSLCIHHDV